MPSAGSDGRPADHQTAMPMGTIPTHAASIPIVAAPERVAGGLEPDVPGEMQDGRDGDQAR